jgi:Ras-related protein Rab-18
MIGESGCGKTSLFKRFAENKFNEKEICTISPDCEEKSVKITEKIIKVYVWDTAGQERFKSVTTSYMRNSNACFAVYDISRRSSFIMIEPLINEFLEFQKVK